ncbi:MAG: PilZ domain-containing protein [Myxococcota bacterium]
MTYAAVQKHPRFTVKTPVLVMTSAGLQTLELENISLGGAFVRTDQPPVTGGCVRMRLDTRDAAVDALARVIHVVEHRNTLPPGMGVRFEEMTGDSRGALQRYVDKLASAVRERDAHVRAGPRFVGQAAVTMSVGDRGGLQQLWLHNISKGGLFVETKAPPGRGTLVTVELGTPGGALSLKAEVVHVLDEQQAQSLSLPAGVGLQFLPLDEETRRALSSYLEGRAAKLSNTVSRAPEPPGNTLLAEVRRFFECVDRQDMFGALGLPATATAPEVEQRVAELRRLFRARPDDASPGLLARLQAGLRVMTRVEEETRSILKAREERQGEIVCVTEPAPPPPTTTSLEARVRKLVEEAGAEQFRGELGRAEHYLMQAQMLAADDDGIRQRLAAVRKAIKTAEERRNDDRAQDLLMKADVFSLNQGMREQAAAYALQAATLTSNRSIRVRALVVLSKAGAAQPAVKLAKQLIEEDAQDPAPWQALLRIYESREHWALASRVAETLARLCPDDAAVARHARQLMARVRR